MVADEEEPTKPEDSERAEQQNSPEAAVEDLLRSLEQEMAEAGTLPEPLEIPEDEMSEGEIPEDQTHPVSYTHLTLPTIYSV